MQKYDLRYLLLKPKVIRYKHIVGPKLNPTEMYDVVFDDYDLKIRKLT